MLRSTARTAWMCLVLAGTVISLSPPTAAEEVPAEGAPAQDAPAAPAGKANDAAPEAEPEMLTVVTLREAAARGDVEAEGFKPTSYRRVHLRLKNVTDAPLHVDLCGSHLRHKTGSRCQRLGLGPVVTPRKKRTRKVRTPRRPPGTVVVSLEPGEEKQLEVQTCCLDAGVPAPRGHRFRVAKKKLPPVREKVLRWWADHPETRQGNVNSAIWRNKPTVTVTKPRTRSRRLPPPPKPKGVAAQGGSTYTLRSDGELMAVDPDGTERFLGTDIDDVYPTSAAVYAVAAGDNGAELWRLTLTGDDPWRLIAPMPAEFGLRDLQVAPNGTIVVIAKEGLYRVDVPNQRFRLLLKAPSLDHLSVRFGRKHQMSVTQLRPATAGYYQGGELKGQGMAACEIWNLDLETGRAEVDRTFWNVRQMKTGEAGTYALTPAGKLRRMVGRSLRTAPGQIAYERILEVGRAYVWLESKQGRLVAVDKAGRRRFASGPVLSGLRDWGLDRHTDEAAIVRPGHFYRVDPRTGKEREVGARRTARSRRTPVSQDSGAR